MGYRDDLEAAHARSAQLEEELEEERQRSARLEEELAEARRPKPAKKKEKKKGPAKERRLGGLVYRRPAHYAPLLALFVRALAVAWVRPPKLTSSRPDNLLLWIGYSVILWPIINIVARPLYYVLLVLLVAPWTALLCAVLTLVWFPFFLLAHVSLGASKPPHRRGWIVGRPSDTEAAMFLWMVLSFSLMPLLPLYITLLTTDQ